MSPEERAGVDAAVRRSGTALNSRGAMTGGSLIGVSEASHDTYNTLAAAHQFMECAFYGGAAAITSPLTSQYWSDAAKVEKGYWGAIRDKFVNALKMGGSVAAAPSGGQSTPMNLFDMFDPTK